MPSPWNHAGSPRRRTLPCQARLQSLAASDHRGGGLSTNRRVLFSGQHRAPLPPGYHRQFSPGLKALLLYLTYETNVSQAKLRALVTSVGLSISAGELSALLRRQPGLTAEYQAIGQAGLASSPAQHICETPTRVQGVTAHCHILATSDDTRYHTTPGLDRQAVLDVLRLGAPRRFCLNAAVWAFLDGGSVPAKTRHALHALPQDVSWDEPTFLALLEPLVPATNPALRRFILGGVGMGCLPYPPGHRSQTRRHLPPLPPGSPLRILRPPLPGPPHLPTLPRNCSHLTASISY